MTLENQYHSLTMKIWVALKESVKSVMKFWRIAKICSNPGFLLEPKKNDLSEFQGNLMQKQYLLGLMTWKVTRRSVWSSPEILQNANHFQQTLHCPSCCTCFLNSAKRSTDASSLFTYPPISLILQRCCDQKIAQSCSCVGGQGSDITPVVSFSFACSVATSLESFDSPRPLLSTTDSVVSSHPFLRDFSSPSQLGHLFYRNQIRNLSENPRSRNFCSRGCT